MTELNSINSGQLKAEFIGLQDYEAVLAQQLNLVEFIRGTQSIHVLGLEFRPVITLGVRGRKDKDLARHDNHIPVVPTDRGGQATLHTPGQLVIYPMIDLKAYGLGVRDFVCMISKGTADLLRHYGIESFSADEAPGLYTATGKIAFMGIRLDRGVVRHGLSLNVSNDLSHFSAIRSCGVASAAIDRVKNYETKLSLDLNSVFQKWVIEFKHQLDLVQRAKPEICSLQSIKDPLKIVSNH